jgi:hypothetical protein
MNRNDFYTCGIVNRKPTVERMLKGFPSRLAHVTTLLGATPEVRQAIEQFGTVKRCQGSYERTNGKTFFNLFQASARLNDQLLWLETETRYLGECKECSHRTHDAGLCKMCNCGLTEVVGGY